MLESASWNEALCVRREAHGVEGTLPAPPRHASDTILSDDEYDAQDMTRVNSLITCCAVTIHPAAIL